MRNPRATALIFLLALVLSSLSCLSRTEAEPGTITVPEDYSTIQGAINAANPGDTILVLAGIYFENIVVNKTLTLAAENKSTVIDAGGSGTAVAVAANNVSITGFTIRNSGVDLDGGILIDSFNDSRISRNTITDNYYGLYLAQSNGNIIEDNILADNVYGILLERSSNYNKIGRNAITDNPVEGIFLISSLHNTLYENTILRNLNGLFATNANSSIIYRNNFINNTEQVFLYNSFKNQWDNGAEGNYWSDHASQDLNEDGISDAPYLINANNTDTNPLMNPWTMYRTFEVSHEGTIYRVLLFCNSTVGGFNFDPLRHQIGFSVTGPAGKTGFCNATIPKQLLSGYPWLVLVNRTNVTAGTLIVENSTHTSLFVAYTFSIQHVKIINADVVLPIADAGGNQTVDEDTEVVLDGSASWSYYGIANYTWTFTDVTLQTLTGASQTHIFHTPGNFVVTLNISDASGEYATDTVSIIVHDVTKPLSDAKGDKTVHVGEQVTFDATSSTDNVGIISYEWDFGDGTTQNGSIVTHAYEKTGEYNVTLTVRDGSGNYGVNTVTVTVTAQEAFPWWTIPALLIVAIGVVALVFLLFLKRKRPNARVQEKKGKRTAIRLSVGLIVLSCTNTPFVCRSFCPKWPSRIR